MQTPDDNTTRTSEIELGQGFKALVPEAKSLYEFATKINNDPNAVDLYELERSRRGDPPSMEAKQTGLDYNRTLNSKGTGPYQMLLRAERLALKDGLRKFYNSLPTRSHYTLDELMEMVDFLPNARLGYLNKLIKRALEGLSSGKFLITYGDLDFVKTIWINQRSKDILLKLLSDNVNPRQDGYSIEPVQSRSGIRLRDAPGIQTGQYIALRNPGNVYMPIEDEDRISEPLLRLIKRIDERMAKLNEDLIVAKESSELLNYSDDKSALTKVMLAMLDKLTDRHVSIRDLKRLGEQLNNSLMLKRSKYFISLAQPWKHRTARVPTLITPPSSTFSVRGIVSLTTNALGNVAFVFNPYYLDPSGGGYSSFAINNNAALTGTAASNFFIATSIGQTLPADFYTRYRLVSSGLKLYCYPSSNNDNGIASISVSFEPLSISSVPGTNASAQQWGDFNQIENGYFKQTTTVASRVVQEHSFIPIDETFFDYTAVGVSKTGFLWTGYISGAAPSSTIARVEFICNYEALLDNQYVDYLPSDVPQDEVDPKMIPIFINSAKKLDNLKPETLDALLSESNTAYNDTDVIVLPTPPKTIRDKEKEVKQEMSLLSDTFRDFFPSVPKSKQTNWVSDIMDLVSPIASSIIQQAAGRFMPLPFKIS